MDQDSNRQKTMEDIDGGLHPAVDEQSQGERQKDLTCFQLLLKLKNCCHIQLLFKFKPKGGCCFHLPSKLKI